MRVGFSSPERQARFLFEAEVLGNLRHPAIAQVYEAGTHAEGGECYPWFAMELVAGARDIVSHARAEQLGLEARLALFLDVCDAVHHGHQKGVIHRDVKAGNVLVDAEGRVKVIDFGVARVTRDETSGASRTQAGQIIGTLATMSPEQLAGDPSAVDARSDVYSLGVVLYELVAGKPPYALEGLALEDALRRVQEARPRRTEDMPQELHWILLRALEKDPARRYASASEFAADLRRFARRQPVIAGPPSRLYLARKFVQRHTLAVTGSAALALALVAGILGTSWQAAEARAGRRAAETQADVARTVAGFLDGLLRSADPERARGEELTARELLDRAAAEIDGAFAGRPAVEAALRTTIGLSYQGLGHYAEAERHLCAAADLSRRAFDGEDERTLEADNHVTAVLHHLGRYAEAAEAGRAVLAVCRRALGDDAPCTWRAMNNLAPTLTRLSAFEDAERLLLEVLERIRAGGGSHQRQANEALSNLAFNAMEWGRFAEAEKYYREALAEWRRVRGDDAPETLILMGDLGNVLLIQDELAEAEPLLDEAVATSVRVLGAEHPRTLGRRMRRADLWISQRKYAAAEAEYRALVEQQDEPLGALNGLAICLEHQRRFAEAAEVARECLALAHDSLGAEHPNSYLLQSNLGRFLRLAGEHEEALALQEPAERALVDALGAHPHALAATFELALLLRDMGDRASARELVQQVVSSAAARTESLPFLEDARLELERLGARGARTETK